MAARKRFGDELDDDQDGDMDLVFTSDGDEKPAGVGFAHLAGASSVRVRVVEPFQVVHNTVVFRPGDVAEIPASVAADWIRDGWVEPAE